MKEVGMFRQIAHRSVALMLIIGTLAAVTNGAAPVSATTISQWSVYELTLTAAERYANPYTEVTPSATFIAPDGGVISVRGFWDGEQTFRYRFTPTMPGSWAYTTSATPADAGLASSGTIEVTAPTGGAHGFLRRTSSRAERDQFVFDDGTPFFMWGQTYYELIRNVMAGGDWEHALRNSRANGLSKVRIALTTWGDPANPFADRQPFIGDDHDRPDPAYWQAFDRIVHFSAEHGLVNDLILFVDAARAFGTPAQDERYVRYVIARYAAYPHVIWCLTNEWEYTGKDRAYWDRLGTLVRAEDPWAAHGDRVRSLSIHQKTGLRFAFSDAAWVSHATVQYGVRNGRYQHGDQWGHASIVKNQGRGMPVINDEYGYIGEEEPFVLTRTQHRQAIWAIALAGGYGSAGDGSVGQQDGARPIITGSWRDHPEYTDIRLLTEFFTTKGIKYWWMVNKQQNLRESTRVYAFGARAAGYVIYAAEGGTFKFHLPSLDGNPITYRAYRYNPRDGAEIKLEDVTSGAVRSFVTPAGEDWVVYLLPT
jgi:Protein of unknown function (DUF4038)/Domain of unknown function (DUF5060)/Putative collagen-binding domain of a collagenase